MVFIRNRMMGVGMTAAQDLMRSYGPHRGNEGWDLYW